MRHSVFWAITLSGLLASCTKQEDTKDTFTMSTGVSVAEVKTCANAPARNLSIRKSASDYLVTATGSFACDSKIMKPYLTIPIERKATLVIQAEDSKSSCECFRSVTLKITGRLEAGDVLYVLNSGEVIGHAELP